MKLPLILRLKKNEHKEIARAQDLVVQEITNVFEDAVLHGGTAIWRCYNGNRFSEYIDVYLQKNIEKINLFFANLEKIGFFVEKKKIGQNSLFSNLKLNRNFVKFEALFKKVKGSLKDYETVEGNFITVYALTPEELINEKIEAYLKRLEIRDLYDIYFLLRYVEDKAKIKNKIQRLIDNFKKPIDEKELRILILEGVVPNFNEMLDYIKHKV